MVLCHGGSPSSSYASTPSLSTPANKRETPHITWVSHHSCLLAVWLSRESPQGSSRTSSWDHPECPCPCIPALSLSFLAARDGWCLKTVRRKYISHRSMRRSTWWCGRCCNEWVCWARGLSVSWIARQCAGWCTLESVKLSAKSGLLTCFCLL